MEDIDWNNMTLRERSRVLYMSSPVATSAIDTNRTKVVGTGLVLKPSIKADLLGLSQEQAREWQARTKTEFQTWANNPRNCDAIGLNNFANLQQLVIKSWLQSGDSFAVIKRSRVTKMQPYSLRLHVIEADRISTPDAYRGGVVGQTEGKVGSDGHRIHDGVEVDASGLVVAYFVASQYPKTYTGEKTIWTRVEACGARTGTPNILHVMDSERPDQYRGVPYLSKVIEPLLQLRRFTESELMAALIQSFFTAWITTNADPGDLPFNEVGMGSIDGIPSDSGMDDLSDSDNEYELGPGTINVMEPGEDITFGSPNIPTTGFDTFTKTICRLIGAGLEIPYDVLIKEFNSSYSASRGALLEAWEAFKMRRSWLVSSFCQPVYELWLTEAVARGRVLAPGFFEDPLIRAAWCGADWIGPAQGSLDPLKEAKADLIRIQTGVKTHSEVTTETTGGDWDSNMARLAVEQKMMQEAGLAGDESIDPDKITDEEDEDGGT